MQTTLEETHRHVVRLSVEVPPEEFARDLDRAYRKVAGQIYSQLDTMFPVETQS